MTTITYNSRLTSRYETALKCLHYNIKEYKTKKIEVPLLLKTATDCLEELIKNETRMEEL